MLTFHFYMLLGILTFYTRSKRISGFDMAPPASAMLAGAAAAGTFIPIDLGLLYSLNCFFFVGIVWKVRIKLHGVILVSYILFLHSHI